LRLYQFSGIAQEHSHQQACIMQLSTKQVGLKWHNN